MPLIPTVFRRTTDVPLKSDELRAISSTRWLWLTGVFFCGLLLVVGLKVLFADLYQQLAQREANERSRLFIGDEIVRGIGAVETAIYRLATASNRAALRHNRRDFDNLLHKLEHDLLVLQQGGVVRREIFLNIEGRDQMVREVSYSPSVGDSSYVMEVIEIAPLLDSIRSRSQELEDLLIKHWDCRDRVDRDCFFALEGEIALFTKNIPPLFFRIHENANRLFFESNERLRTIESHLAEQRAYLQTTEWFLVGLLATLAALAGLLFVRQTNEINHKLRLAWEDMRTAKEEAERASSAKSDFVSRMSHELRTPMNAILGFAQLLDAEPLQPSQKNYVRLINRSGQHLLELINQVLDLAKIEAGCLTLENVVFDLGETLAEVSAIASERAAAKGLQFVAQIAPDLPPRLVGDPTRLRQVLINLTANAVKFTEIGSVELNVTADGKQLLFGVRDTGIGIDAKALDRLFVPFGQADESITRKHGGTGLGLIISLDLVRAMGSDIEVDSTPGAGSCFRFSLPIRLPEANTATDLKREIVREAAPASRLPLSAVIDGPILLVDDNEVNQLVGTAMLNQLGLRHDVATNGLEALQCLADRKYALVLMDMEMPEMDGLTATRTLRTREDGTGERTPIIAMTANALQGDRERCLDAGMDGYIAKPINIAALEQEIRRVFSLRLPAGGGDSPPFLSIPEADALPLFDRQEAVDRLGDEALFNRLVPAFTADYARNLQVLQAALQTRDWPQLRREAHTLKGLLATFGGRRASRYAQALETAAAAADEERCKVLEPMLRQQADTFLRHLLPD